MEDCSSEGMKINSEIEMNHSCPALHRNKRTNYRHEHGSMSGYDSVNEHFDNSVNTTCNSSPGSSHQKVLKSKMKALDRPLAHLNGSLDHQEGASGNYGCETSLDGVSKQFDSKLNIVSEQPDFLPSTLMASKPLCSVNGCGHLSQTPTTLRNLPNVCLRNLNTQHCEGPNYDTSVCPSCARDCPRNQEILAANGYSLENLECLDDSSMSNQGTSLHYTSLGDNPIAFSVSERLGNVQVAEKSVQPIVYIGYESERQMPDIMRLIQKDLSEPYSVYTYRYFIHNWPNLCFLAFQGPKCVGAVVCKLDMHMNIRRGYIAMLAVDENCRKQRIGSNLVLKAIEAMIADDADEVVLETEITNKPALQLYENLGFVRDKRLFRYYLNGVDALRLKLWLR